MKKILLIVCIVFLINAQNVGQSWTADNGNGTYTNPLFYDEFSDPDIIRVEDDFYMTGTTMHTVPGLPVLHSKDLVNWELLSYAFDRFNLGPEFNLDEEKEAYGQGIWAPCIRHYKGMFYIFSNVNGHGIQIFTSAKPEGPWQHKSLKAEIYDLSVLFDDDEKIYAVYKYNEVHLVELKPDLSGVVEGTDSIIISAGNAMGEGHHIYKVNGKYFIISANFSPSGRMQCARADNPYGPYETVVISSDETMGFQRGWWLIDPGIGKNLPEPGQKIEMYETPENEYGAVPLHQGGIVDLPNGEWWGFSMMDFRSMGRTTCLSPVTWFDGWPYFGLTGNLGRTPRTWLKPINSEKIKPKSAYTRSDNFNGPDLQNVWQWNHNPNDEKWKLNQDKGSLRLYTLPAKNILRAKNTLTQRVIGPESYATVELDAANLKNGDIAGLAYLNIPYAYVGIKKVKEEFLLSHYDLYSNKTIEKKISSSKISFRASGNYEKDIAQLSYSFDGKTFIEIGDSIRLPYQLKTFQGSRYALFAYNTIGNEGGYVDFEDFKLAEPLADRSNNIPLNKIITLTNLTDETHVWANPHGMMHSIKQGSKEFEGLGCQFKVHDRKNGRVSLEAMNGVGFLTVVGIGLTADVRLMKDESEGSLFQWQDLLHGNCMLMSLKTNRYVGITKGTGGAYSADFPGTLPNRKNGTVFIWREMEK